MTLRALARGAAVGLAISAVAPVHAALLFQHGSETGFRYNANASAPLPGYTSAGTMVLNNVLFPTSATSVRLDSLTFGIRRLANASAVDVHFFLVKMDGAGGASTASLTDLGIQSLPPNGPAAVTQPVVFSLPSLEVPLTDLAPSGNPGLAGFWVGLRFEGPGATDGLNGWRITAPPAVGASFDEFWGYDPSVPIDGYWAFTPPPDTYFYVDVSGTLVQGVPPPPPCAGDLNHDSVVDGADLGLLLAGWGTPGPSDINGDGTTDGADLGLLLAHWGLCPSGPLPDIYGGTIPVNLTLQTPEGPHPVSGDAQLLLNVSMPDETGNRRVEIEILSLDLISVPIMGTDTGGIDLRLLDNMPPGTLTPGNQLTLPLSFTTHYWLLDQTQPQVPTQCLETGGSDGTTATALWTGSVSGFADPSGGSILLSANGHLNITAGGGPEISSADLNVSANAPKKEYQGLGTCPEAKKCNKLKVCVQPVFIGTGPDDANKTGASFADFKAKADTTWAKCCIEFEWKEPKFVNNNNYKTIKDKATGDTWANYRPLLDEVDKKGEDDCIEVYFISHMQTSDGKNNQSGDGLTFGSGTKGAKMVVADDATVNCTPKSDGVLAHELGHAMGDCKHDKAGVGGTVMEPTGKTRPDCPGQNTDKVNSAQCDKVRKGPLAKEKNPKEPCCLNPDS